MGLYDEKLKSLEIDYENIDIETSFGQTRIIQTGNETGKPVVIFHGINAGAPLTLEALKGITNEYLLFAIDTVGQATKSEATRINIRDNSYALWADEVIQKLDIQVAYFIGISYGAYILQKLISYRPKLVEKCVFVVPSGLVNGNFVPTISRLTIPLIRYLITKKETDLKKFIDAFVPQEDEFIFRLQKELLTGLNMDCRRPTILKEEEIEEFTNPVYMIVADDDVFFPGHKAINKAKAIFKNFKEAHILKNSKHMPAREDYPEIQEKIRNWFQL